MDELGDRGRLPNTTWQANITGGDTATDGGERSGERRGQKLFSVKRSEKERTHAEPNRHDKSETEAEQDR